MATPEMTVAILDDGVSPREFPSLRFRLRVQNGRVAEDTQPSQARGHGDICAAVFQNYCPGAAFGSVKVLEAGHEGRAQDLRLALRYCIERGFRLIHMSLGSVCAADYDALLACARLASQKGTFLVAACKNGCSTAFPASFSQVIGVRADPCLTGDAYYAAGEGLTGIDFCASSAHLVPLGGQQVQTPCCNSYAAPLLTAKAYALLRQNPGLTLSALRHELAKHAPPHPAPHGSAKDGRKLDLKALGPLLPHTLPAVHPPLVLLSGPQAPGCAHALAHMLRARGYLPLLLAQDVLDGQAHAINDAGQIWRYGDALAAWLNADVLLLETTAAQTAHWPYPDAPDLLLHGGEPIDPVLLRAIARRDGAVVQAQPGQTARACLKAMHCLLA